MLKVPWDWILRLNSCNFITQNHLVMSEFEQVVKEGTQNIGKRLRRLLLWALLLVFVGFMGYIFVYCNFTVSKGTTSGTLTNITYKGILFKTHEGNLNTGTINLNPNIAPDKTTQAMNGWNFSVPSAAVAEKLDALQGQRVKLFYRKKVNAMPWQGKTNYLVYNVEKL